jgi:superfamily I DNA/RNA helicase
LEQLYQTDVFLNHLTKKYQTILIDEIQDYDTEWVKIIRDNFLASDGEMVLFGDQAQNIYNRDEKKRESSIAYGFGRWEVLTRSYRSQLDTPLINLFKEFQEQYLASKYKDIDVFESLYISRQNSLSLDILEYEKYSQPIDLNIITKQINNKIKNNKLIPNDITIICSKIDVLIEINKILNEHERTMTMFESKEEKNSLLQTFKAKEPDFKITEENKVLYDKAIKQIRNIKKNFFMQNSGLIKLSTTHSFKGRESQTVFCILLKEDDPELIYTVLTRAKINLFIFDVVDSKYGDFFRRLITTSLTHQHEPSQP